MTDNMKFLYLRDPKNKDRVLSIAWRVRDHFLEFAYAINNPDVDRFSKKVARKICSNRLLKAVSASATEWVHLNYSETHLPKGHDPIMTLLLDMIDFRIHNPTLKRIINVAIDERKSRKNARMAVKVMAEHCYSEMMDLYDNTEPPLMKGGEVLF